MAAYIITPTAEEWEIIGPFLAQCQQGAIIVSPEAQAELKEAGHDLPDYAEYDFGGEADIWIDMAVTSDAYALREVLNLEDDPVG